MTRTRSDRLIALGAVDAGWPEPALCLTGSVSFANRHGNGERTHLAEGVAFQTIALCGVGIDGLGEAVSIAWLDAHLCAACLREAEEQQR
jgi:hypothetical protein